MQPEVYPPVLRVWHGWHAPDTDTEGGRPGLDTYPASKSRADPVGGAERGLGLNRGHGSSAGAGGGRGRSGVLAGPGLAGAGRYPRPLPAAAAAPPGVAVLRRGRAPGRRELADPVQVERCRAGGAPAVDGRADVRRAGLRAPAGDGRRAERVDTGVRPNNPG